MTHLPNRLTWQFTCPSPSMPGGAQDLTEKTVWDLRLGFISGFGLGFTVKGSVEVSGLHFRTCG